MATMATGKDEEAMVRQTVEQVPLPSGVRLKSVQPGSDWEGDPAWRIIFLLSSKAPSDTPFIRSLNKLVEDVVNRIVDLHTGRYPYVNFEAAKRP